MSAPLRLNLEPLERALGQLEAGLAEAAGAPHNALLRDGVIHRFEYTIDLSTDEAFRSIIRRDHLVVQRAR